MPVDRFDLSGKVALVTGGSKGLGASMARALALAGANVIINSRHDEELRSALPLILEDSTAQGAFIAADIAQRADVLRLARESALPFGPVDILVNNAGINIVAPFEAVQDEDWDHVLALNLYGPMALSRALIGSMAQQGWGRVIHVSSVFGETSRSGRAAYSASKAGLLGLTKAMALEYAKQGVTINALLPGPFETPLTSTLHPDPEARSWWTDRVPLGRWGQPKEIEGPLLLLASDAGRFITGTSLVVDGGWLAQ